MSKNIRATFYMKSKLVFKKGKNGLTVESDPQGYLFSEGKYRTKILPEDLPEWYVYGYLYKRYGYISTKGVKHLLYVPNYIFDNHLYKYDALYISYGTKIEPYQDEHNFKCYKGYDHVIDGLLAVTFLESAGKFSNYDVRDIRQEIEKKREWYYERNIKK